MTCSQGKEISGLKCGTSDNLFFTHVQSSTISIYNSLFTISENYLASQTMMTLKIYAFLANTPAGTSKTNHNNNSNTAIKGTHTHTHYVVVQFYQSLNGHGK